MNDLEVAQKDKEKAEDNLYIVKEKVENIESQPAAAREQNAQLKDNLKEANNTNVNIKTEIMDLQGKAS